MASVVTELYRHQIFHITDFVDQGKEGYEGVKIGVPQEHAGDLSNDLLKIRSLESVFQTNPSTQSNVQMRPAETIRAAIDSELPKIDEEVSSLTVKRSNAETRIRECQQRINELKPFALVPLELDLYRGYGNLTVYAGYIEHDIEISFPHEKHYQAGKDGNFIVVFVESKNSAEVEKNLADAGFQTVTLPGESGTVQAAVDKYTVEKNEATKVYEDCNVKIVELKAKYADLLAACDEVLSCDVERAEAPLRFATTDEAFVIDGWIPADEVEKVVAALNQATGERVYVVVDSSEVEDTAIPVEYNNPSYAKPAELFMDLYSRPKYKELDPTIILAIMFPLLFGFIVGDLGYGLLYLLLALVLRKTLLKMGEMGVKAFFVIIGAAISTSIFGLLYSEFFGVSLPWHSIIFSRHLPIGAGMEHAMPQVIELLIISIMLGVIYISVGRFFGMINHYRMDHPGSHRTKAILSQFGWNLILWGILVLVLSVVDLNEYCQFPFALPTFVGIPTIAGIIGAVMIIVGCVFVAIENPLDLMELPTNTLSHMLSFCRLAAVGLSSVAIAMVVNFLAFDLFITPAMINLDVVGVLLIIVGVIILILGHALNVALGILGGAIHPIRLHYVEFFTKFYQGGGIIYKPFGLKRKFSEE
ncbi:MAG: V-type ATP synthase subunit I [Methanocorpusculum sp.]|nr:V-type ATP synthase subunit I [Methanocorpusculum sp.]MDD4132510.1 V-type ATP synthase subunit I [Methanocorpusculum sp.]